MIPNSNKVLQSGDYNGQNKKDESTNNVLQRKLNIEQRNVTFATNINEILLIQFEFEWITFLNMFNYILKF
jgi:hypothetical protein